MFIDAKNPKNTGYLIPSPQYSLYREFLNSMGSIGIPYELNEEEGWDIDLGELERAYGNASASGLLIRGIVVINPGNPTGGLLSKNRIKDIINLLKFTYRSFEDIGKQYKVEARTISRINRGIFHRDEKQEYPIRNWKATSSPLRLTYEEVSEIIRLLLSTNFSLREIAKEFNVEYRDILNIKNGTTKAYRRKDLTYPLRNNN